MGSRVAALANKICSALLVLRLPKLILSTALAAKPAHTGGGQACTTPRSMDTMQEPAASETCCHTAAHALMLDIHLWTFSGQCRHLSVLRLLLRSAQGARALR